MPEAARIILLNGAGSSGKTWIAKALQAITDEPYLHVQMDSFIDMLPEHLHDHPDGISYQTIDEDGRPAVVIRIGPTGARVLAGMRRAIAAMAAAGNNLVVDDVILDDGWSDYASQLSGFSVVRIGVFASLDRLEARERARGDRLIGLARWQFDRVHRGMDYDLKLDTDAASPAECAALIKRTFGL